MIVSPGSRYPARSAIVSSVILPDGSITQIERGASIFFSMSARLEAPVMPSPASLPTISWLRSNTIIS